MKEKPYLHETTRIRLNKKFGANSGLCGYIRSPNIQDEYVIGKCALKKFKKCEGELPQNMRGCKTYNENTRTI